jgi:hypothetical protein
VDRPAEPLEHLLPEAVAVAGGLGAVVGGAVALDAADEAALHLVVEHAQVDAVAGDPHLRHHAQAAAHQLLEDLALEGRLGGRRAVHDHALDVAALGEEEELAEVARRRPPASASGRSRRRAWRRRRASAAASGWSAR